MKSQGKQTQDCQRDEENDTISDTISDSKNVRKRSSLVLLVAVFVMHPVCLGWNRLKKITTALTSKPFTNRYLTGNLLKILEKGLLAAIS